MFVVNLKRLIFVPKEILNYCFNNKQKWDYTIFFPWFNWSYLQTVWSAVNLKYNPYLLYIAFWFANCLQEYENYCCKIKTLEKQGKDHSYQETNWREQVLQPTMGLLCFVHLFFKLQLTFVMWQMALIIRIKSHLGEFWSRIRVCVSSGAILRFFFTQIASRCEVDVGKMNTCTVQRSGRCSETLNRFQMQGH